MQRLISGKDLLHKILDFCSFWQKDDLNKYYPQIKEGNESTYYRIQQINILLEAFDVIKPGQNNKAPIQQFLDGDFLSKRELKDYDQTLLQEVLQVGKELVIAEMPKFKFEERDYRPFAIFNILFSNLLSYRLRIHPFTRSNQNMNLAFSFGGYYSDFLRNNVGTSIENAVDEIDHTLSLLIDPTQKELTFEDLKEKYNYPDVDLSKFDFDYSVDNF